MLCISYLQITSPFSFGRRSDSIPGARKARLAYGKENRPNDCHDKTRHPQHSWRNYFNLLGGIKKQGLLTQ